MNKFFSNAVEKIKNWPVSQKVYASLWLITAIFLIVVIILFVVWQQSSLDTVDNAGKLLTPEALYQQDVIAGLTFTTVVILAIAIFTTAFSCYNKKKKGSKNANPKI